MGTTRNIDFETPFNQILNIARSPLGVEFNTLPKADFARSRRDVSSVPKAVIAPNDRGCLSSDPQVVWLGDMRVRVPQVTN